MSEQINLDTLVLGRGSHGNRKDRVCLMEAVAWWAGEEHGDEPECVSRVLAAFGRGWDDGMRDDTEREQLKRYIAMLPGTAADPEADERRSWMAADWLVRTCAPAWLGAAGIEEHAETLAAVAPLGNGEQAQAAMPRIRAAWAAAWDTLAPAVSGWAAPWAAVQDPGGAAARAALIGAWAAAREARDARVAALAAAGVTRAAAGATRIIAGDTVEATVGGLQASAHELYRRMISARGAAWASGAHD